MYLAIVREYLATGSWPKTDVFSFSLPQGPLDTLHEWGSYFLFYLFYQMFQSSGLLLLKTLLILSTFLIPFYQSLRSRVTSAWILLAAVLAIYISSTRSAERSSLFGDFFANMVLFLLLQRKDWNQRTRIALPIIFLVWVNLHPSFPVGLLLISLSLISDLADRGSWRTLEFKSRLRTFLLCLAACLVHPQGWYGFLYPFSFFFKEAVFLKGTNFEWAPIWDPRLHHYWELKGLYLEVALVAAFSGILVFRNKSFRPIFEFLLLGMLTYLGLSSARFAILASAGLLQLLVRLTQLEENTRSPERKKPEGMVWMERGLAFACLISVIVSIGQLVQGTYASGFDLRRIGIGLDGRYFPDEALRFLDEKGIQGPIFNTHWLGCYLAWRWDRKRQVFAHGFMTNTDFIENDYLALGQSKEGFERVSQKYGFQAFLIGKEMSLSGLLPLLKAHPNWKLAFEDRASYVFLRPAVFD